MASNEINLNRSVRYLYTDTNQLCATMRCKMCCQIEGLESVYGEAQRIFKGSDNQRVDSDIGNR